MLRNEHVTQCHTLPAGRERAASALAGRMVGNGADETLGPVEGSLCRDNAMAAGWIKNETNTCVVLN